MLRFSISYVAAFALIVSLSTFGRSEEAPQVLDSNLKLKLIAEAPIVRTPTGIAIDEQGRVYVIESHTHFRPENYEGPKYDRILRFEKNKEDKYESSVFFEGTTHTMSLGFHPDGSLYVATRMEIFKLNDKNDNGKIEEAEGEAAERTNLVKHETSGNYPHNGLSGFAFDFAGNVYFGQGENLGASYKVIGSDGATIAGGGEGGNIYCIAADGSKLRRVATGFWNPFAMYMDPFGRLFAVDNDPDSRPPCRLLHVVEGGDYGYRFRNGRKGTHPFTSWNGELPGTLPMVAGTGEAPSGIIGYEHGGLGMQYAHDLLVNSWGDHRIERYRLKERGASFSSSMELLVVGNENFRPVGIAIHPDGSLWLSDWVDKSYQLHGKGGLWRLLDSKFDFEKFQLGELVPLELPKIGIPLFGMRVRSTTRDCDKFLLPSDVQSIYTEGNPRNRKQFETFLNDDELVDAMMEDVLHGQLYAPHGLAMLSAIERAGIEISALRARLLRKDFAPSAIAVLLGGSIGTPSALPDDLDVAAFTKSGQPGEMRYAATRRLDPTKDLARLKELLGDPDPFIQQAARWALKPVADRLGGFSIENRPAVRLGMALVLREVNDEPSQSWIPELLHDSDAQVRFVAIQWVGEARLKDVWKEFSHDVRSQIKTRQELEAFLATSAFLADEKYDPGKESRGEEFIVKMLLDDKTSPERRAFLLRMLRADHPSLTDERLNEWYRSDSPALRLAVLQTVSQRGSTPTFLDLAAIATNEGLPREERLEAISAMPTDAAQFKAALAKLVADKDPLVATQAGRTIRTNNTLAAEHSIGFGKQGRPRLDDLGAWRTMLDRQPGDAKSGRLVFHHAIAQCSRCHEAEGRGTVIGPNLTNIGKSISRERLIQSIVQPNKEIAPQFALWQIETKDGRTLKGMYMGEEVDGTVIYSNEKGETFKLHPRDVEIRTQQQQSLMPEGLPYALTDQEFRDLLAYLSGEGI